jgi:hydrogenase maturation protease
MTILDLLSGSSEVFLIGAVSSGGAKGSYLRFDVNHDPLPSRLLYASRHLFSVMEALELSRNFGRLPGKCILFGIVGADFSRGEGLSREVRLGCKSVADAISTELHEPAHSSKEDHSHA